MLELFAKQLDNAASEAKTTLQLTIDQDISLADAYQIQRLSIQRRLSRGEKLTGYKLGFTSRAKMIQMGVDDLIWGRLTDAMSIPNQGVMWMNNFIHPRVEPEIAFLLNKPLSGKVSIVEAMDAIQAIAPALEIIDSRFRDFKFSHIDVVADNCSSSGYVVGGWQDPTIDFGNLSMNMSIDNQEVAAGFSSAILDHPINALVEAARCIAEVGEELKPGQIIFAGAATAAVALEPGQSVHVDIEKLGSCSFTTV